jgi:hypothetical protein
MGHTPSHIDYVSEILEHRLLPRNVMVGLFQEGG